MKYLLAILGWTEGLPFKQLLEDYDMFERWENRK
jgi:hypothetical protein